MSSCAVRRWGPGTCKERINATSASNELSAKLEQMKKDREADMYLWTSSQPVSTQNPYINGNTPDYLVTSKK
jgi:hypothetical protein